MEVFYDTEFLERGGSHPIDLISIGMVRKDGQEYYAVANSFDVSAVLRHEWLRVNVWPHLPTVVARRRRVLLRRRRKPVSEWLDLCHSDVKSRDQIASEVRDFVLVDDHPKLWASYCAYDHVVLCQLFGTMIELPEGFPMFTHDLKAESVRLGDPRWPDQPGVEHHALADARHVKTVWEFLRDFEARR